MLELTINTPVTVVISGGVGVNLTDALLYLNGVASGVTLTVVRIDFSNCWKVTFTPIATGVYSLFGFGVIQANMQCHSRSLYSVLDNLEDEALGSWSWNKNTGILSMLRQNGTTLSTYTVTDTLTSSSRERVS